MRDDRCYSVSEIASHLGIYRDAIYKWIERKGMPDHKPERLWRFGKDDIYQWLISNSADEGRNKNDQAVF